MVYSVLHAHAIIQNDLSQLNNIVDLANLVVPNIMAIGQDELHAIKDALVCCERSSVNDEKDFFRHLLIGLILYRQASFEEAIETAEFIAEQFYAELSLPQKSCLATLQGITYRSLGRREEALSSFHFAIENFANRTQDFEQYLNLLSFYHIAELNAELKNYSKMLELHLEFYRVSKAIDYEVMINRSLNGIGRAYFGLEDFENALRYFQLAQASIDNSGNIPVQARNWHDTALVFCKQKQYDKALLYLNKALEAREKNNLTDASVSTLIEMANVYIAQSRKLEASCILKQAMTLAETCNYEKKLIRIYGILSALCEESKDYQQALEYCKKYHGLSTKLNDTIIIQRENERVREANTQLSHQKKIIDNQKKEIELFAEKLLDTNKSLQNFAYIAAHDLKAPITQASSFAGLIEEKYPDLWDESDKAILNIVTKGIGKLSNMIDDLLSLSRLDNNLPPRQDIDVNRLLSDVCKKLQITIKALDAEICIQDDMPTIRGHESLLGQLFQNLIENALKYRRELRPKIEISYALALDDQGERKFRFEVKDNGRGIADCVQRKMFELFSGTNRKDSSGIGLATCKKIITNYGGQIWVESIVGLGSSFFFTIPKEDLRV